MGLFILCLLPGTPQTGLSSPWPPGQADLCCQLALAQQRHAAQSLVSPGKCGSGLIISVAGEAGTGGLLLVESIQMAS